jgi:stage III sporulation protein SpoIIIAA
MHLIGPRQVGKTTLAHQVADVIPTIYLDLKPQHRFVVNSGSERCPIGEGLDAIGVMQMARILSEL